MVDVDKEYIDNALTELISSFGLRESVKYHSLVSLIEKGKVKESVTKIAEQLGLPIQVNISYVSSDYDRDSKSGFEGQHVVEVKPDQGTEGITAQVGIPPNLPFYGSKKLKDFPIDVRLGEDCARHPKTFITVMAHELTHVVLYAMRHQKKDNEIYTDLATMVLGFFKVMNYGRKTLEITGMSFERRGEKTVQKTSKRTTVYGYLSDKNFDFAYKKITDILDEYRKTQEIKLDEIDRKKINIVKAKSLLQSFYDYRDHLNASMPDKISREDGEKISKFNQADYKSSFNKVVKEHKGDLAEFKNFLDNVSKYNDKTKEKAEMLERKARRTYEKLNNEKRLLQEEIDVMKKYSGFSFWFKREFLSKIF